MIRFFTFSMYHNKKNVGSNKLRVENLIKYWPEADLYKYGEKPHVLIFQKVYCTWDYQFPANYDGLKILDICDPDWLNGEFVRETVDAMDAVVVPTEALQKFISQFTDKPVVIIKDRFDLDDVPDKPTTHEGEIKHLVWFGYSHNAEVIRLAVPSLENRNIKLTVISNEDPQAYRWAMDQKYDKLYTFKRYDQETIYQDLQKFDGFLAPQGNRPIDKYKSENRTVMAWFAGLPIIQDADQLEALHDPKLRNEVAQANYKEAVENYDTRKSVEEYKHLIEEITA